MELVFYHVILVSIPRSRSRLFSDSTTTFWARNLVAAAAMPRCWSTFQQVAVMILNQRKG